MGRLQRAVYWGLVGLNAVYQKLFLDLRVRGRELIPPGPKIYVTNHITSTDPHWVLPVLPDAVHILIGPGYQSKLLAPIFDYVEQINVMPAHRKTAIDKAVAYLQKGETIYVSPEGDLQPQFQLGHFYPGTARIYRRTRVPIIPIAFVAPPSAVRELPFTMQVDGRVYRSLVVLRGPFCINIGAPFHPGVTDSGDAGEDARIMEAIREKIRLLVDDVRANKFWQPVIRSS
jgi:1-acyl-sn-glycerol-3-phosphate acyltransferase